MAQETKNGEKLDDIYKIRSLSKEPITPVGARRIVECGKLIAKVICENDWTLTEKEVVGFMRQAARETDLEPLFECEVCGSVSINSLLEFADEVGGVISGWDDINYGHWDSEVRYCYKCVQEHRSQQ